MELIVSADVAVRVTKFGNTSLDGGLNGFCRVVNAFRTPIFVCREKNGGFTINWKASLTGGCVKSSPYPPRTTILLLNRAGVQAPPTRGPKFLNDHAFFANVGLLLRAMPLGSEPWKFDAAMNPENGLAARSLDASERQKSTRFPAPSEV